MNYSSFCFAKKSFETLSVMLSYWLWVICTDVACLWDLKMALSYLLLVCYEIRFGRFVYQPIKSLLGICGVGTL